MAAGPLPEVPRPVLPVFLTVSVNDNAGTLLCSKQKDISVTYS